MPRAHAPFNPLHSDRDLAPFVYLTGRVVGLEHLGITSLGEKPSILRDQRTLLVTRSTVVKMNPTTIQVAIRPSDSYIEPIDFVSMLPENESSYAESEGYARRLAPNWFIQELVFDGFEKPEGSSRLAFWARQPLYGASAAWSFKPIAFDHRWSITRGDYIGPVVPSFNRLESSQI